MFGLKEFQSLQNDHDAMRFSLLIYCGLLSLACIAQDDVHAVDSMLHLLSTAKEDSNKVLTLLHLASEYENNKIDSADKYYSEALQTSEQINQPFYIAKTITWYTFTLNNKGELDKALQLNLHAYAIAKQLNNANLLASTPANVANTYFAKGDYENALKYFFEALPNIEAINNKVFLTTVCNNISASYRAINQSSKALVYAQRALVVSLSNEDTTGMGDSYQQVGNCYGDLKRFDSTIAMYKKAVQISDALHDDYLKRTTLGSIGFSLMNEKKYAEAITYIDSSIALSKADDDPLHFAQGNEYLAKCYLQTGDINKADAIIEQIMPLCEQHRFREVLKDVYLDAFNIAARKQNFSRSEDYFNKWQSLNDSLINESILKNTTELEAKYQAAQKQKQILALQKQQEIEQLQLKQKNIFILSLAGLLAFILVTSILINRNIQRKKLLAEKENQLHQQTIIQLQQEKQLSAADAMLRGQEEERSRLAKDLHDGLGGRLSGIKQNLNAMKGNQVITEESAFVLNKIISQLDGSIDELRNISRNMMPEALIRFGLKDALHDYCATLNESNRINITYQAFGLDDRLPQQAEIIVFRIVQELLNNIMKHADAKNVIVQLVKDETRLHITVEDDGKGFDTNNLKNVQGVGWLSIRSRVDYFNGTIDINSAAQKGTSVNIEFQNAQLA